MRPPRCTAYATQQLGLPALSSFARRRFFVGRSSAARFASRAAPTAMPASCTGSSGSESDPRPNRQAVRDLSNAASSPHCAEDGVLVVVALDTARDLHGAFLCVKVDA